MDEQEKQGVVLLGATKDLFSSTLLSIVEVRKAISDTKGWRAPEGDSASRTYTVTKPKDSGIEAKDVVHALSLLLDSVYGKHDDLSVKEVGDRRIITLPANVLERLQQEVGAVHDVSIGRTKA